MGNNTDIIYSQYKSYIDSALATAILKIVGRNDRITEIDLLKQIRDDNLEVYEVNAWNKKTILKELEVLQVDFKDARGGALLKKIEVQDDYIWEINTNNYFFNDLLAVEWLLCTDDTLMIQKNQYSSDKTIKDTYIRKIEKQLRENWDNIVQDIRWNYWPRYGIDCKDFDLFILEHIDITKYEDIFKIFKESEEKFMSCSEKEKEAVLYCIPRYLINEWVVNNNHFTVLNDWFELYWFLSYVHFAQSRGMKDKEEDIRNIIEKIIIDLELQVKKTIINSKLKSEGLNVRKYDLKYIDLDKQNCAKIVFYVLLQSFLSSLMNLEWLGLKYTLNISKIDFKNV